jgi:hypothetical protein
MSNVHLTNSQQSNRSQNCLATKIEDLGLEARAPYDPLFR